MKQVKRISTVSLVLILFSVFYYGCDKEPKIEREKLVKVYVEKTVAQSKYSNSRESLDSAKQAIFNKYNLSEEEYNSAIEGIEPKTEYWDAFFKEAKAYLDSLKTDPTN